MATTLGDYNIVVDAAASSVSSSSDLASKRVLRWERPGLELVCYILLASNLLVVGSTWLSEIITPPLKNATVPLLTSVFIVCGSLRKRRAFLAAPHSQSYGGLAVLCVVCIMTTLSALFQMERLHSMAWIPLVGSFIWAVFGYRRLRIIAPLLFLSMFMMPDVPEYVRNCLSLPLQYASTLLMAKISALFIPINSYDHYFVIKGLIYDVAPTCSGLTMLSTFLFAFAILQTFENVKPIAYCSIFLLDPCLTLLLNSVRLFITALAGFYVSQPFAVSIHSNLEYALLPFGMLLLWILTRSFRVNP